MLYFRQGVQSLRETQKTDEDCAAHSAACIKVCICGECDACVRDGRRYNGGRVRRCELPRVSSVCVWWRTSLV